MFPNLNALQAAHNLTDADMGRIIGRTPKTYARKKAGKSSFYASDVLALSAYFRASADYIFECEKAQEKAKMGC